MYWSIRFILVLLIAAVFSQAWTAETRHRLFVLTDMGNEPDDSESMVRLLTYSNTIDIEGLVATTSTWLKGAVNPQLITERITAYGQVRDNLLLHESGFPTVDQLNAITTAGVAKYGMSGVGAGNDTPGSELLITAVDRADARPLWVSIWGGPNTLAQALWKVQQTRSAADLATFVSKLRVFAIADQDDSGVWIRSNFPQLFYMYGESWQGISSQGGDLSLVNNAWVDQNVRNNHGPLGALYPRITYIMEGDTPAWLYLIPVGLGDPEHPDWGSWGGRYRNTVNRTHEDVDDTWLGQTSIYATVYRWRQAFQNDFQARMDWNVQPYAQANHPPVAVVAGGPTRTVTAGSTVVLSAAGSSDPDGHVLSYEWIYYDEPSSFNGAITISGSAQQQASFVAPQVTTPQTVHVILAVRDNGVPNLFRYQRVIVTVNPSSNQVPSVSLTSPAAATAFTAPAGITMTATANDSDGTVAKVEFYQGATKLGEDTSAPYVFAWSGVPAGVYSLTARVIDNQGGTAVSAAVNVTVGLADQVFHRAINLNGTAQTIDGRTWEGSTAPDYSYTGNVFANQAVALNPATDTARATMIRSSVWGNCSVTMSAVPNGSYAVYLYVWEDNASATFSVALEGSVVQSNYVSGPAGTWAKLGPWPVTISDGTINVSCSGGHANVSGIEVWGQGTTPPVNQAPSVSLTAPVSGMTYTAPASISLTANASDSDGTIAKVEFFQGTTKLGEDTSAPYVYTWSNVVAGGYSLTAKATDNAGAVTTSTSVTVTVEAAPSTAGFYRAINVNGDALTIDGNAWEGKTAADFNFSGGTFANQSVTLSPTTDTARSTMIRSSVWGNCSVVLSNVPNGAYSVYLYVWEDNASATFSVALEGSVVQANYVSGSAGTWAKLGPWPVTISDGTINVSCSGGHANVSGIEVWSADDGTTPPVDPGTLPAGWVAGDIGGVAPAGSTSYANGTWTLAGSGADIWGSADTFHFARLPVSGDVRLTVRVQSQTATHAWAKAGLMIRSGEASNARHASIFATPSNGVSFQRRTTIGGASAHTSGNTIQAPVWLRLERVGTIVTGWQSPDGVTWTMVAEVVNDLGASPLVGLAVTSHLNGTLSTAVFTDLSIIAMSAGNG